MAVSGTNLDINSIVSQLMTVDQRPLRLLATKEASNQAKLSAYGSIKNAMSTFENAMKALTGTDSFVTSKTTVSNDKLATATAKAGAAAGSYSIEITSLAQAQKLASGGYEKTSDPVGSGTLTIQFGSYAEGGTFTANGDKPAQTIEIKPNDSSLVGVRDAINAANAGVTASIMNDGSGNRLVIGSTDSGTANALRITVSDDGGNTDGTGLSALAFDASAGGISHLSQTVAAQDAKLVIDGITVTKSSNRIEDAIEGVTLNLVKEAPGETFTLAITHDKAGAKTAVDNFVKAYNDLHKTLTGLTAYNADTKQGAILQGDSTLRRIQSDLRGLITTPLDSAGGGVSRMLDIGVSLQVDGSLKVDNAKLQKMLDDPTKDIATLFASVAKPSDSLVSFVSAKADATSGRHELNITQLATQGNAITTLAATTVTAGVNDTLKLNVDGVDTIITLNPGTYTAASFAAELQSRINGANELTDADVRVSVKQDNGVLSITSDRYGAASKVDITGGTGAALFSATTSTEGLDVAGTIGGVAATGSGQNLEGLGISVNIIGGGIGDRGAISYARGFAAQFVDLAKRFLQDDGVLDSRTDGLTRSIEDIADRRDVINVRLVAIERRYRAQFTALDVMLSSMQSTSNYLTQQLANLPKIGQ